MTALTAFSLSYLAAGAFFQSDPARATFGAMRALDGRSRSAALAAGYAFALGAVLVGVLDQGLARGVALFLAAASTAGLASLLVARLSPNNHGLSLAVAAAASAALGAAELFGGAA